MKKRTNLRWFTTLGCAALVCASAMAVPAKRTPITVTQPDGTELTILLRGDERSHAVYTIDGHLLRTDNAKGYVYATLDKAGTILPTGIVAHNPEMRSAEEKQLLGSINRADMTRAIEAADLEAQESRAMRAPQRRGPGLCDTTFPSLGEQNGLIILVEFKDIKFGSKNKASYNYDKTSEGNAHAYWSNMLNGDNFTSFGATASCRQWFLDNSRDSNGESQFVPSFDVYGPVTLSNNASYYGENDWYGNDSKPEEMVIEACKLLDDEIDFTKYDRDNDGVIDNVYVFYAGFGEADGGPSTTVWPHSWEISTAGGQIVYVDGKLLDHYACSNETDYDAKRPDGIGTFTHEFSHVMGLPDLYCTSSSKAPYTPDSYSVLDYGPYNNDGKTPPNYSAYERYALGWMEPKEFGASGNYEIPLLSETNQAYIIKTERANEYYLVENRQQEGWDEYLPGHGMLIWHVDYVKRIFDGNKVNNTASHQYVDLIEANKKYDLRYLDGHPFPGTSNVTNYSFLSWANIDCGVSFANIKESSGKITVDVTNTNETEQSGIETIGAAMGDDNAEWYTLQGVRVERPVKGLYIRKSGAKAEKVML